MEVQWNTNDKLFMLAQPHSFASLAANSAFHITVRYANSTQCLTANLILLHETLDETISKPVNDALQ